jgi:hypothetical protein
MAGSELNSGEVAEVEEVGIAEPNLARASADKLYRQEFRLKPVTHLVDGAKLCSLSRQGIAVPLYTGDFHPGGVLPKPSERAPSVHHPTQRNQDPSVVWASVPECHRTKRIDSWNGCCPRRNIRHVALLFILLSLFALIGFGTGSSSTGVGHVTQSSSATGSASPTGSTSSTVIQRSVQTTNGVTRESCVVVTWRAGRPAHRRPCHKAPAKP